MRRRDHHNDGKKNLGWSKVPGALFTTDRPALTRRHRPACLILTDVSSVHERTNERKRLTPTPTRFPVSPTGNKQTTTTQQKTTFPPRPAEREKSSALSESAPVSLSAERPRASFS
mmetsp:Transcript_4995/g.16375  ORF Transcript_4995/g.16375 Transcript_4995/m.16375 type:complete len:116 (+) Transcript_4995:1203-1550(+)